MWFILCLLALSRAQELEEFDKSPFDYDSEELVGADEFYTEDIAGDSDDIFAPNPADFDPYLEEPEEIDADDEIALGDDDEDLVNLDDGDLDLFERAYANNDDSEELVGDYADDFFADSSESQDFPEWDSEEATGADMPDYLFADSSDDSEEESVGDILQGLNFDDIVGDEDLTFDSDDEEMVGDSDDEYESDSDEEDSDEDEEVGYDEDDSDSYDEDDSDEYELAAEMPDYLFDYEEEVGYSDGHDGNMPDYLFGDDSEEAVGDSEEYDDSYDDSDEYDSEEYDDSDEDEDGYEYLDDDSQEDIADVEDDSEDSVSADMPDYLFSDSDEDEVGYSDDSEEDMEDAFSAFEEALSIEDDDEVAVGDYYNYEDLDDYDEDSVSQDKQEEKKKEEAPKKTEGDEKKDKQLLVYFLQKVLHKLPLPTRVLFVRRFKKRYENPELRNRMFEIVKKMRGTMTDKLENPQFRQKLKAMVGRIRGKIQDNFANARTMMEAKKGGDAKPAQMAAETEGDVPMGPKGGKGPMAGMGPKGKGPMGPMGKPMGGRGRGKRGPMKGRGGRGAMIARKEAMAMKKEAMSPMKYDGGSKFNGKYPLTKFYGDRPVVVYYVPIIVNNKKSLDTLKSLPGKAPLMEKIREKLAKIDMDD